MMNIVHVEDEKPLKDILRTTLSALDPNIRMVQFTTAEDALVYTEQNLSAIDLFILDIRLPGTMNGMQLAEKIRELKWPGNMVITSAFSRPSQDMMAKLNCEYYRKPWHLVELMHKLQQYRPKLTPKPYSLKPQD
jgi:DNA-binding response OmpR family regulator